MSMQRVDLIVASLGEREQPVILLLSQRGRWTLPSALCGQGCQTWRLALALLANLIGPCPGQRVWLLGCWPPAAAYLALIPGPAQVVGGRWWPAKEAAALLTGQETWFIRRARQWLADGGASRRGIV
ncbi:hypothetical protein [Thermogemmatispora sp.]|jgi:hypothetical protein|uniref:hypothetical protein n=1 Tax=Thermogemmatispora sp. TaxID=1968838 RepID=UPI0035E4071E